MRNRFADTFYELGKLDPRLCVVVADISPAGSIAKFRTEFPDRFINTGVAEQIMIAMCAGMAQRGLRPFAYTIATFTLYRPFEMVRDDLCYQNLPVTVVLLIAVFRERVIPSRTVAFLVFGIPVGFALGHAVLFAAAIR